MTNRLANETSPYLLQHADNPVDWYPWGSEAFELARKEDKPILLSIGYSACHWCHVMAHESFEDPEIAAIMNELFVNIKVDREERPDVDAIYMAAVQTMTGQGGWPMTVFLTPDGKPFYGGTYYPPEDRGGMPGFKRILQGVNDAYRTRNQQVTESADRLAEHLNHQFHVELPGATLDPQIFDAAIDNLHREFDQANGGFGDAPKFPAAMAVELLLRIHHRLGDDRALNMTHLTLDAMARGGLYDQVGGGFHRYAVDAIWLVPHFEKMLYDNALLAYAYAAAYQHTGETFYRAIVEETLDYLLEEMTSPEGGFYSTQDADTEGEEGKFYVWTPAEIRDVLGDDADQVIAMLGVTEVGNFEGSNVLSIPNRDDRLRWREAEFAELRRKLQAAREERTRPGRDEKILTSWNGMTMRAFAYAARVLDDQEYLGAARKNARFLHENVTQDARLFHSFKDGDARIDGFLEDYAYLVDGLVELYMASFEVEWLAWAEELAREAIALFYDPTAGMFFDTPETATDLIARPREISDNATPSGTSVISESLLRLAMLTGEQDLAEIALDTLADFGTIAAEHPYGLSRMLCAIDTAVGPAAEVALVGDNLGPLLDVLRKHYLPRIVIAASASDSDSGRIVPLIDGRETLDGRPTAYVCVNHTCQMPTTDPQVMLEQIREALNAPSAI